MERCIREITAGEPMETDLGSKNGPYFVNVVGIGLDVAINRETIRGRELIKKIEPTCVNVCVGYKRFF